MPLGQFWIFRLFHATVPMCRWVYPASSHSASDHRSAILLSSVIDQRSSISDPPVIGGLSAAFATAPVISGAGRMQMQVLRNLGSAISDQRSAIIGSSSPPIYALLVLQTSETWGPAESRVLGLRSSLMVFGLLYFLLFNCVFDFGYLEIWLKSIILSNLQLLRNES